MLLRHFVLSYSRRDMDLVEGLRNDLVSTGVPIWKDDLNIEPGTPNYDQAIRQALQEAYAVLFLASPHAAASNFVPDEISLAINYKRRVIPVWIDGENYIDCVPLGMGKSQYIDARVKTYSQSLSRLTDLSKQLIDEQTPKHQVVKRLYKNDIVVSDHLLTIFPKKPFSPAGEIWPDFGAYGIPDIQNDDAIVVNPGAYLSLKALLDDIYTHYLRDRFRPLTYGKDWLLQRHLRALPQLAAPSSWFFAEGCKPVSSIEPTWAGRMSLQECGLKAGTSWEITELEKDDQRSSVSKIETVCIFCRDEAFIDSVVSDDLGKNIYYLLEEKYLTRVEPDSVKPQDFPNFAIIRAPDLEDKTRKKIRVLVQTQKKIRPKK